MILPVSTTHNGYLISTNQELMQPEAIHQWLSEHAYWSKNIPFHTVQTAIGHSHCIGVFKDEIQVGFGRLITDFASFAYLADVYVEEAHRGQGLGKMMMEVLLGQPWISGLRSIMLATLDAHKMYEPFGFTTMVASQRFMQRSHNIVYGGNVAESSVTTTERIPDLGGLEQAI